MKKINYLIRCYPGFKYLPRERQVYYAKFLPLEQLYSEYSLAIAKQENLSEDTLLLLEFQHKKQFSSIHLPQFQTLNQEIARVEAKALLKKYFFGYKLLPNHEKTFFAASIEFQQIKRYIHKLYSDLESKYIRIIEENNALQGWFSDCHRIPADKILSDFASERMNLQMQIRQGINYFLYMQGKKSPATEFTHYVKRLNQAIYFHYANKVNRLFHYFPALMKINFKNHNQLYQHFVILFLETQREVFNEVFKTQEKNVLIIRCMAMECYYILEEFTASFGYAFDLQEFNRKYALEMAKTIYESFQKNYHQNTMLNDFIKRYKIAFTENVLYIQKKQAFLNISLYDDCLSYTYTEQAAKTINQMWSYTISSQPAKVTGLFVTRFLDTMGFLQTMNLSTENDIALFFVATHATRMSEDVSHVKRLLIAIVGMVLGTIKHELYEASLEPNPKIRELKLAAIILFYTAMIALAALALSFTTFMTLFAGFEFIAIPVAIILVIAIATLATKGTFYLINAYHEWKHNSINQRMQDTLGLPLAKEVLTLYQNAFKSVDSMLAHLNEKTGLTHQALDFKVELEKLKLNLKKEWKLIRDDKTYPIDEIKKIIKDRVKYFYDKEKCSLQGRLQNEVVQRFEDQQKSLVRFCTDSPVKNIPLSSYKHYAIHKNEVMFFKKRIKKLKNISDMLEEKSESNNLKTQDSSSYITKVQPLYYC